MKKNATCPDCGERFAGRAERHTHQMKNHRGHKRPVRRRTLTARRAKPITNH